MTTQFSHVVVAYDFSDTGRTALHRGIALAVRAPFHLLDVVCIVEPRTPNPAVPGTHVDFAYTEEVGARLKEIVENALQDAKPDARVHFNIHVRIGKPVEEILAVARGVSADLIIVGCKGLTGIERLVLGSVAEHVVREAGCPVMVARPKAYPAVELLDIEEVERERHYVPPHRYYYEDNRVQMRPANWPLY